MSCCAKQTRNIGANFQKNRKFFSNLLKIKELNFSNWEKPVFRRDVLL